MNNDKIRIIGARENNLKNVSLEIPKNKLVVMTGLSGSGKSSLAFDTIYQEGQRRYVESLSSYARQFLGNLEKPLVDSIEGLSPSISIDQKSTSKNPRSTVGTVTEIYDYFRILFARIGTPHCITHNEPIESQSAEEIINKILELKTDTRIMILAPVVNLEKGTHKKTIESLIKDGFVRAKINGELIELDLAIELDKNKKHKIDVVIDRIVIKDDIRSRVADSVETALKLGNGKVICDTMDNKELVFSEKYACKICDYSLNELEPRLFSFNSPLGACSHCNGLGRKSEISEDLIINKKISINKGAILPYKNVDNNNLSMSTLETVCQHFKIDMNIPFEKLPEAHKKILLYGTNEKIHFKLKSTSGRVHEKTDDFKGIITHFQRRYAETSSEWIRDWIDGFMIESECPVCKGKRLNAMVLHVKIADNNISDLMSMPITGLMDFIVNLKLDPEKAKIAELAIKEIKDRIRFLIDVGLDYLTLSRAAMTLSGGEAQRIRLATQIGSQLSGVLYVLDEPSIGLHQRDNEKLINTLKKMRDLDNTLIVVEHDEETMLEADYLIDIGPGAGIHGGYVVAAGTPIEVMNDDNSLTGRYLAGKERIDKPTVNRLGNGNFLVVKGCTENNLKNVDAKFPLGTITCVTGVSGSGKSTLVNQILYRIIHNHLYKSKDLPGKYDSIDGLDYIEKIIDISQSPIGRTPRSNPATYTGVFDDIREIFTHTSEAKLRGYEKGRFSFNVKGGRCEHCGGDGVKRISMHFLPDVFVVCDVCKGKRYNRETLDIKYKGKSIADILDMTIEDSLEFFKNIFKIKEKLQTLFDVGLGYLKLGQSSLTLSGGEAQRVKLASELHRRISDKTLYILDEPTTGLHTDDIRRLLKVINKIADEGATVIIIEHNLDVIMCADHIIDLGYEGGNKGGQIIYTGSVDGLVECKLSYTGQFLKKHLQASRRI